MKPYYQSGSVTLYHGNALEVVPQLGHVCAIVTDPPYGLSFMGKKWDYDVPSVEIWQACLDALRPGGHLLAFAGTRTQHRMAVRIEDAGFEIRDMIAWVYGCLSEDSEVLTKDGWERYHIARTKEILVYDIQADFYKWEKPDRWNEYRVESDTAYRIQSDHTDQIVSRGHCCIVERGGELVFVPSDELAGVEAVPTLPDDFFGVPETGSEVLQQKMQRALSGAGLEEVGQSGCVEIQPEAAFERQQGREESGVEGRADLLQTQRQVFQSVDQVCSLSGGVSGNGTQGRLRYGASVEGCGGDRQGTDADGMRSSCKPRRDGQQAGEPDVICNECGSQAVRTRPSYQTTLATVTTIKYSGLIWCPTVSTGAFVARRNGKVFITGNSGFPKSLDVSKSIDKAAGAEREVVGDKLDRPGYHLNGHDDTGKYGHGIGGSTPETRLKASQITAPATDAAKQWAGWGTALKPALEPITMARKPLEGTVAANVLAHGCGGLNVDGCRVAGESTRRINTAEIGFHGGNLPTEYQTGSDNGRFPANLIHDGSDEVVGLFPEQASGANPTRRGSPKFRNTYAMFEGQESCEPARGPDAGSAARFFYCAKASRSERGKDNTHPTVKPIDLMRYLIRLVNPPGGIVLDPFAGSGTTLLAARLEGAQSIGVELDEKHCEIIASRLDKGLPF
jgi:site-specific DNA-methyltransferase (adenine-specific)